MYHVWPLPASVVGWEPRPGMKYKSLCVHISANIVNPEKYVSTNEVCRRTVLTHSTYGDMSYPNILPCMFGNAHKLYDIIGHVITIPSQRDAGNIHINTQSKKTVYITCVYLKMISSYSPVQESTGLREI